MNRGAEGDREEDPRRAPAAPADRPGVVPAGAAIGLRRGLRRRRPLLAVAKGVAYVGLAYLGVQVALSHWDELSGAATYFDHVRYGWVVVAAVAETISLLFFALVQRRLLSAGGVDVGMGSLAGITVAGNAIANSLPAGGAFATVFAYRQFRRVGADEALATWTLLAVTGVTALALALIALIGLAIAGEQGPVSGIGFFIALLVAAPVIGGLVLWKPRWLAIIGVPVVRVLQKAVRWPHRPPEEVMDGVVRRLVAVEPHPKDWLASLVFACGNWTADCGCLVLAFLAVGAPVPLRGLLLAYGAAQVAANLPITPGGLGVVEGSLTIALVAFGGSTAETVAAVLMYRLLSFWVLLPIGWGAWGALHLRARRHAELGVTG